MMLRFMSLIWFSLNCPIVFLYILETYLRKYIYTPPESPKTVHGARVTHTLPTLIQGKEAGEWANCCWGASFLLPPHLLNPFIWLFPKCPKSRSSIASHCLHSTSRTTAMKEIPKLYEVPPDLLLLAPVDWAQALCVLFSWHFTKAFILHQGLKNNTWP